MQILDREPLILDRSEAYIGVLIDDLVTKENHEPYRMMTSRAEYRLLLRQDNADMRLTEYGYKVGLISEERYKHLLEKKNMIEKEISRLKSIVIGGSDPVNDKLAQMNSTPLNNGTSLADLIRRPELNYDMIADFDPDRQSLPREVIEQVNINIKYEGYISRELKQVEHFKKLENKLIPANINYDDISGLRIEARQKLKDYSPRSIGQASRISGVSPADITVLLVYKEQHRRQ